MSNVEAKVCAHPACRCVVAQDKKFCSQRCEDGAGVIEISCNCGHGGCSLSE